MSENEKCVKLEINVHSSPEEVYDFLTDAVALSEWFCNISHATPQEGGGLYLWWADHYYVTGQYIDLTPSQKVAYTWHGHEEPGQSQVKFLITKKKKKTKIALLHSGLGTGKTWRPYRKHLKKLWKKGLENLKSVLETGQDLRLTGRLAELGWAIPEVPGSAEEISRCLRDTYARVNEGFEISALKSAQDMEYYAQSVARERRLHHWIEALVEGQEPLFFDGNNLEMQSQAIAAAFSTPSELQKELHHTQLETLSMIANLPGEIYQHKRKYWILGLKLLIHAGILEKYIVQDQPIIHSAPEGETEKEDIS